jgi:hypothetical protein
MKKVSLIIISFVFVSTKCFCQDIITRVEGKDIAAIVLEVDSTTIRYRKFNVKKEADSIILRADVVMIDYEDGTKRLFNPDKLKKEVVPPFPENTDFYAMGQEHAVKYYDGYTSATLGIMTTSLLLSPVLGLIPTFATAAKPPKVSSFTFPNAELAKKPAYVDGYTKKATSIKKEKVWKNWTYSLGVSIGIYYLLYKTPK